jgi:phage-related protein (TIGR01555 family)
VQRRITNDLTSLVESPFNAPGLYGQSETISQPYTFAQGIQYTPMTLNRIALSYGYMGYGLVQTLIDMPVEDAFRGGVEIITDEVDEEELKELYRFMEENKDWDAIKTTEKWARLFGGAALLIETEDADNRKPLNKDKLKPESVLRFIPADRWELLLTGTSMANITQAGFQYETEKRNEVPFMYYTIPLHESRVMKVMGKEAPSYIRLRLQGWGMSELERCMRDINSFVKFQNVIFELIDEAKIDVFKIQQFNDALATAQGTALIQKRIALNAALKNYKNATVMDAQDDFDQKQITFSGLADIYQELRMNLSASLQIPEAKLFGQSSSGFSSGQDVIENYNALVESGVREKTRPLVREVISLRCQQLWGFVPEFDIKFSPLRVLGAVEQEAVDTSKQNRAMSLFDRQGFTMKELLDSLDKDKLINIRTEVQEGTRDVEFPEAPGESDDEGKKENAITGLLKNSAEKTRNAFEAQDRRILSFLRRKVQPAATNSRK